ncbi:hypothetical protein RvY_18338 [Ramazzottius varieornatus]|uniref:Uncharacterized protein n=1 Tax=Ramazzottius varieornatus TaxID=947166 RepID=A0A1D1WB34_RAMVA|nr:hypothetical protein RvY_18338 [Ramazzottius varieornatus]
MKDQAVLDSEVWYKEGSIICQYHPYAWTVSPKFVAQYCYRCGLDPRPAKVKRCSACRHAN